MEYLIKTAESGESTPSLTWKATAYDDEGMPCEVMYGTTEPEALDRLVEVLRAKSLAKAGGEYALSSDDWKIRPIETDPAGVA